MSAVWLRARAQLRGRARATVLLAVLVGLAGGMILAAVAGARRSNAALPRFLAFSHTIDAIVWVFPRSGSPFESRSDLAEESPLIAGLPGVQGVHRGAVLILSGTDPASRLGPSRQLGLVELDPARGELLGRPMIVAGRLPRGDHPEEVTVDEELAGRRGLRVGSAYRIGLYTMAQFGPAGKGVPIQPGGPAVELRVVGIMRQPRDLLPLADGTERSTPRTPVRST